MEAVSLIQKESAVRPFHFITMKTEIYPKRELYSVKMDSREKRWSFNWEWGESVLSKNGFLLTEALLGLLILGICIELILVCAQMMEKGRGLQIETKISTQWFYAD